MKEHRHFGGAHGAELAFSGLTAVNALGFSAEQTWAFRRAELTGYGESPFRLPGGDRATMAFVQTLLPTSFGLARMLVLLDKTLTPLVQRAAAALGEGKRVGCALSLPERMDGQHAQRRFALERRQLEAFAYQRLTEHGLHAELNVQARGNAGGAASLLWACVQVETNQLDAVIVGGVDTYYDPDVMDALMLDRRVFCTDQIDAFIPGEGASFALLARSSTLRAAKLSPTFCIETVSVGEEPCRMGLSVPCMGVGLSRTLMPISDRLRKERRRIEWILGDVTNEDYRAHELQLAFPRIVRDVTPPEFPMEFLPMAMGDLGAATIPTALAIAGEGLSSGDPAVKTCAIFGSSAGEDRGALLVSKIE